MRALLLVLSASWLTACGPSVESFSVAHIDRSITGTSQYPVAVDVAAVGKYPGPAKSGSGYFYDEVLEYRVWLHPERGAEPLAGDDDYFVAFAQYEPAAAFARSTTGAEEHPLALVRQIEWLDEPTPGQFVRKQGERITEWQVAWLEHKRGPDSIDNFLANPPHADQTRESQ